jgi:hypothetical protein
MAKSTSYEDPNYVVSTSLLLFRPFWAQIFSLAPYSQTRSVYILPLYSGTKFHTYTQLQAKL